VATTDTNSKSGGLFSKLRDGVSAAGRRVGDMELDGKISPVFEQGKQITSTGLKAAADRSTQAWGTLTGEQVWDEQRALVDQVIEVLSLQQGLIEELRARVAALEVSQ
jgi:hypothetical protein